MNSAFNDKQAGKGKGGIARQALRAALACALVLGSGGAALAQQHGDRDPGYGNYGGGNYGNPPAPPERHAERFRLPQMERDPRQEASGRGYDDPRRGQAYPQAQGYPQAQAYPQPQPQAYPQSYPAPSQEAQRRGGGRSMTADERAEMRRQINEAKDLYPQRH
jgi:hypothetical protein